MNLTTELAFTQLSIPYIFTTQLVAETPLLDTSKFLPDTATLGNVLGVLALAAYALTLLPTILRIVFPSVKKAEITKQLFKNRRHIGIASFLFTLGHAWVLVIKRNFDFFDIETYWQYLTGVSAFIIFTLLTITSNDWSIKNLGPKKWKTLHQLTYIAMFILIVHIWHTMLGDWSYLTPIGLIGITVITILFITRLWIERKDIQQKSKGKQPPAKLPFRVFN